MFRLLALVSFAAAAVAVPATSSAQSMSIAIEHDCNTHNFLTTWDWTLQSHLSQCSASTTNGAGLCRSAMETDRYRRSHSVRITPSHNQVTAQTYCASDWGQSLGPVLQCVATNPGGASAISGVSSHWTSVGCCGVAVDCSATPGTSFTVSSGSTTCALEVFP